MSDAPSWPNALFAPLRQEIADTVVSALQGILDGAEADLRQFGLVIAQDAVAVVSLGRPDLLPEIEGQILLLVELNRLRVVNEQHALLKQLLMALLRVAVQTGLAVARGFADQLKDQSIFDLVMSGL